MYMRVLLQRSAVVVPLPTHVYRPHMLAEGKPKRTSKLKTSA